MRRLFVSCVILLVGLAIAGPAAACIADDPIENAIYVFNSGDYVSNSCLSGVTRVSDGELVWYSQIEDGESYQLALTADRDENGNAYVHVKGQEHLTDRGRAATYPTAWVLVFFVFAVAVGITLDRSQQGFDVKGTSGMRGAPSPTPQNR